MGKFKDLTGMKFNKLTVIEQAGHDCYGKILWRCLCECGNETINIDYCVAVSDLPDWFKFSLLSR